MVNETKLFERLDRMTKLIGIMATQEKNFREKVKLLSEIGLSPSEIAEITGKTVNFVNVTKHGLKKKNG
ncbi:hypothetical protein KAT80_03275 [Candidatus Pacearchaeota archaeon]|nr:hypothetical protein [Candidatus Pacearchaeota archaeon]